MVGDLRFRGGVGKRGLMFVPYYGMTRAFIANYSSWREYARQGTIAEVATALLSHETLHIAINRFSLQASARLDNLFGRSNSWELYRHGLGELNAYSDGYRPSTPGLKSAKKKRRRSARTTSGRRT